jgi:hypothetical protein
MVVFCTFIVIIFIIIIIIIITKNSCFIEHAGQSFDRHAVCGLVTESTGIPAACNHSVRVCVK